MYIITDKKNIIQDAATRRENLSRGYGFDGYVMHEIADMEAFQIGDLYEGRKIISCPENHIVNTIDDEEAKIQAEIRAIAIERLKSKGELKSDFIDKKGGI